ncbi:MAG: insulinase family protein [Blastocatellia bacterium]|nr:insulinase family protein [Blastocatellia bacterium]
MKFSERTLLIFWLAFLLSTSGALGAVPDYFGTPPAVTQSATVLPKGIERVTSVEGITEYRMNSNGLRILLFPDPSKQTITVNLTYLVGSRHENYGETGMAHLLEHLMFKGSKKHSDIPQEMTARGAVSNASTWLDRTNYYETFAATEDNLTWALDLEADRMVNSFIAKKDLDSEMTVVRNEYEMGENDPLGILIERATSTAYLWHNYGKSTIGARSDIEQVPIERLQAFWRNYYQPDNAILLVAGKFDEAKTLKLIQEKFGLLPKPKRQLQNTYTVEPTQDGERSVTLRRVGDVQAACALYHIPAGSHPDFAALEILTLILGDTPSGRLHKSLVETGKAAGILGDSTQLRDPSVATFAAQVPKEQSLDEVRDLLLKTIEGVTTSPVTKEEVERARTKLLKQFELAFNSSDEIGLELSEWIAMGDWRLMFLHRDRLRSVTVDDVQRVARTYLKPSNRTVGSFIPTDQPDRSEIPAAPDVTEMLKGYKGDAAVATGEAFEASPENIDNRTVIPAPVGGLKLALLPKKTRGGAVVAQLRLRFGDEKSLLNRSVAGSLTGEMLRRGTAKHTRQQLQDEFDRLKSAVRVTGSPTAAVATIETTRDNFPAVLRLVAEVLREPAFPAAEFEQLKQQQITGVEQQRSEPEAVAGVNFGRHMSPYPKGHVRYVPTPEERIAELKAVTLNDVKNFYADFYGASVGEMAVVGDFDEAAVTKLTAELLGDWKSKLPFARLTDTFAEIPVVNQSFETPDKANAMFLAGQKLKLRDDDPDYPALIIANEIFGGGFLNSRLATRIRQKDGLSYSVGSGLNAGAIDQVGSFTVYAICAPQNAAKVETDFKEELVRALKDGFTAEEVEAAKNGLLQARQVGRAQDSELVSQLADYRFLNRNLAWDTGFEQKIRALTPEQVVAALRRHLDVSKVSVFKAGDFAKK